jgi:hypothetical protein
MKIEDCYIGQRVCHRLVERLCGKVIGIVADNLVVFLDSYHGKLTYHVRDIKDKSSPLEKLARAIDD